jgi:hypothetical protein
MGRKKVHKAQCFKVYEWSGEHWTPIHSNDSSVWVVPINVSRKIVGGAVKKVEKHFLDSLEFVILAK